MHFTKHKAVSFGCLALSVIAIVFALSNLPGTGGKKKQIHNLQADVRRLDGEVQELRKELRELRDLSSDTNALSVEPVN